MEKKENRSLAYRLAQVIDKASLASISGGNQRAGLVQCSHESFKASGTNPHSMDVVLDWSVDF